MKSTSQMFKALLTGGFTLLLVFTLAGSAVAQVCVEPPPGLVSWWPGDDHADDIVDGNHGTLQSGATFAPGMVGQAFSLDGLNDYVSATTGSEMNFGSTGDFSLEAWFKTSQSTADYHILIVRGLPPAPGHAYFTIWQEITTGRLAFQTCDGVNPCSQVFTQISYNDNTWHHVTGVRRSSGTVLEIYIDGELENSAAVPPRDVGTDTPLTIGARFDQIAFWEGLLDEVEIYNRALSGAEIQAIFLAGSAGKCKAQCIPPPSNLVSWWSGDGDALDIVDANDGVLVNGATFASGRVGQAFSLDGVDDDVLIGANANLDVGTGDGFTIDTWIFPQGPTLSSGPTITGSGPIVEYKNGVHLWQYLQLQFSDPLLTGLFVNLHDVNGVHHALQVQGVITQQAWNHVAVTYSKTTGVATLYANGSVVASQNIGSFTPQTSTELHIGRRPLGSVASFGPFAYSFNGLIDEVEIYNRALSAAEIQAIFLAGSAGKCQSSPCEVDLVAVQQELADANAAIQDLQSQVGALTQQNTQLQAQVTTLTQQLQALNTALAGNLGSVQQDLAQVFADPQFQIPGATPIEKLQNLVNAILDLNKGRKEGLYTNLGGKPGK